MSTFTLLEGTGPVVYSVPHVGTDLPEEVADALNEEGRTVADSDWNVDKLYDFALAEDASVLRARYARYVVDLNRDPGGQSLYPNQATTELCPTTTFDGNPIYRAGSAPDETEIARRLEVYFEPYHQALTRLIERALARHGFALLFDGHSIRSEVPRLFEGRLPIFNLGTNDGRSCGPDVRAAASVACKTGHGFDHVIDGRFKGGWITRHYGRPQEKIFALQMEIAQRAYMDERAPFAFDEERASQVRPVLRRMVEAALVVAMRLARAG